MDFTKSEVHAESKDPYPTENVCRVRFLVSRRTTKLQL